MGTSFVQVANGQRSDAAQLNQFVPAVNRLEHAQPWWAGTTSGTASAYTATVTPVPSSALAGLRVTILPHVDCEAGATLDLAGLGAAAVLVGGAAVGAGGLVEDRPYDLVFDGTAWHVMSAPGGPGSGAPKAWGAEVIGYPAYTYSSNPYAASISSVSEYPLGLIDSNGDITIPEGVSQLVYWVQVATSYCNVSAHLKCISGTPTENLPYSWAGNNGVAWPTTQTGGYAFPSPINNNGTYRSRRIPVTPGHVYRVVNRCQSHNEGGEPFSDGWEVTAFGFELYS